MKSQTLYTAGLTTAGLQACPYKTVEHSHILPHFLNMVDICEAEMDTSILTVREVAAYLKIKEKTAYRLVAEGKIPGFKVGGSWRFRQQDIENWIEAQSAGIGSDVKREIKD
jgi:excisionase family DNA binding protein